MRWIRVAVSLPAALAVAFAMVGGPDPVRLPTAGVNGWGLSPRHRTHGEPGAGPGAHHDRPDEEAEPEAGVEADDDAGSAEHRHRSELWRDQGNDSAWSHNSGSIRDREEPGHLNRQA